MKPISMNQYEIEMILSGDKTQFRRVKKESDKSFPHGGLDALLWVRETWAAIYVSYDIETGYCDDIGETKPIYVKNHREYSYEMFNTLLPKPSSDIAYKQLWDSNGGEEPKEDRGFSWKSPVTMPIWASRIVLKIKNIRMERLQCISPEDAKEEGMIKYSRENNLGGYWTTSFARWWDLHEKKHSWDSNPLVWVVDFEKLDQKAYNEVYETQLHPMRSTNDHPQLAR